MIKAIFFSKFDTHEGMFMPSLSSQTLTNPTTLTGPKVLHQVPSDSIVPSPESFTAPLFSFPSISSYIIPRQEFCDRLLTICISHYRILGYPVCITHHKYDRNEFIFNFCLVLEDGGSHTSGNDHDDPVDVNSYLSVVKKLARLMRGLEEQGEFLSKDASAPGTGKVYALCEMVLEDLNNYCECMIPIDASNTLNIKLFPTLAPPPPLHDHHVPLSTVNLHALTDSNWDLTLLALLPHINGTNSVHKIASLANVSPHLTRTALRHLLYYGCLLLLDVFSFSAIYACTPEIAAFVADAALWVECARYVSTSGVDGAFDVGMGDEAEELISGEMLISLYASLKQGQSLKTWCIEHGAALAGIDVRRFVTFGVIKGFLYRVHKYAIATSTYQNGATDPSAERDGVGRKTEKKHSLGRYLDGTHCFDEICTELEISERELVGELKRWGDVQIIHR
ncbi:MAG: Nitrogen permease regulator 2 [Pleopsidium flavum]|nr:MAG: Nitrogen permease regulator 2 [Pleopsidium flavum]